jgi:hypothetical protein
MNGNLLGRRFLTCGSTRWGRAGFTRTLSNPTPVLGAASHRHASRKLIRPMATCWRVADGYMTMRTKL